MIEKPLHYFLFPQTVLSERDFCLYSFLLPELLILQTVRPPAIPQWGARQFSGWSVMTDPEMLKAIGNAARAYQEFADIHGEESGLASISHEYIEGEYSESRLQIENRLRRKEASPVELSRAMLIEASVFLEMARDLDERDIELELGISQVDRLESEFREILGISTEEELQNVVETLTPPLFAETSLSYLLGKRMACWLRLLNTRTLDARPVLVVNTEEVIEELVESLSTWMKVQGRELHFERHSLCSIPGAIAARLRSSPASEAERPPLLARSAPARFLQDLSGPPRKTPSDDNLDKARSTCAEWLSGFETMPGGGAEAEQLELSVVEFGGITMADIWTCLDRGWPHTMGAALDQDSEPVLFLILGRLRESTS